MGRRRSPLSSRVLAFLLALTMAANLVPVPALAEMVEEVTGGDQVAAAPGTDDAGLEEVAGDGETGDGDVEPGEEDADDDAGIEPAGEDVDADGKMGPASEEEPAGIEEEDPDAEESAEDRSRDGGIEALGASAETQTVTYIERSWNDATSTVEESTVTQDAVSLVPSDANITEGWYYLDRNVTKDGRVESITGDVHLILGDGFTLDVKGLYVPSGSTLYVYGQTTNGTGKIYSHPSGGAGIGGYSGHDNGNIAVYGGIIVAEGHKNCAGIGTNDGRAGGTITVYGGDVTATGGESGAGIGGGRACDGGSVTIYGGKVTATGGHYAAGIGGGNRYDGDGGHGGTIAIWGDDATVASENNRTVVTATGGDDGAGIGGGEGGNAGIVTINGGAVTAQGGNNSAGIGCGEGESTGVGGTVTINGGTVSATGGGDAAGIGGGDEGHCDTVTINGGTDTTNVTATGGDYGAGIGAGRDADGGTITITGGTVVATGTDSSAGIGGGDASGSYADYSVVEITGGNVTATGNSKGAGIGGGEYGHATVTITGGAVTATATGTGAGIGDGKDGSGSVIVLGWTEATQDDVRITSNSYKGSVTLRDAFMGNDGATFRETGNVSDLAALAAASPLVAWTDVIDIATQVTASSWGDLQRVIEAADGTLMVKLVEPITAGSSDTPITIPAGKDITIDLNGKTLSRGLTSPTADGSVIVVQQGATLTVKDSSDTDPGRITGGNTTGDGGGIRNLGTLVLEGGIVTSNTAKRGGGIYSAGTTTIKGGVVSSNISTTWGGGVYLPNDTGALFLRGGTIEGNTCGNDNNGGGVHVSERASVTISGSPVVTGNKKVEGTLNNMSLADGTYMVVDKPLASEASIGVRMSNPAYNMTSGLKGRGTADNFSSDEYGYTVRTGGGGEAYLDKDPERTVGSWKELQDNIDIASAGDVIALSKDVVASGSDDRIIVDGKKATIDLKGFSLDRNLTSEKSDGHVIELKNNATLTIRDSVGAGKITRGYSAHGGGIYINSGCTLIITSGSVTRNNADDDGGGIYVKGTLKMTGGSVNGNHAEDCGGGIYVADGGKLDLVGAEVSDNTSDDDGAGIKVYEGSSNALSIVRSRITNNATDDCGGGIFMDASDETLTIVDSTIDRNTADDDGAGIYLESGTIDMTGGSLSYNYADNDSGGAKVTKGTTFNATGTTISHNTAHDEEGGGVKNYGTTTLTSSDISYNSAKKQGGGVYNDDSDGSKGKLTLEGCTIVGNNTKSNGGGVYTDKKLRIIGGSVIGNSAGGRGGGVFIGDDSDGTEIGGGLVVQRNNAADGGKDIFLRTKKLYVKEKLTSEAYIGITKENDKGVGEFTQEYSHVNGNDNPANYFFSPEGLEVVLGEGGEAHLASAWPTLQQEITNATDGSTIILTHNYTASSKDDCLSVENKALTIDLNGYTLNRNRTSEDGDGHVIWVKGSANLTIKDGKATETEPGAGTITGGYSKRGGGIYVDENATCTVLNVNITNNKADDDGGGIYSKGTLVVKNSNISRNFADDCGGGIDCRDDKANMLLENTIITFNTAHCDDGGGVHNGGTGDDSTIKGCLISDNIAGDCGGGLYMSAGDKTLTISGKTKIEKNQSSDDGAGINLYRGTIVMDEGSISDNVSANDSGGIKVTSNTTFKATGVTISNNQAQSEEGGGVKNYGTTTLTKCTISNNSSKKEGGGIYNDADGSSAGDLTLVNCTIEKNSSANNGGGIYSDETLKIVGGDKAKISENSSDKWGAGLFIDKGAKSTSIEGKILVEKNDGADIYLREGQVLTLTSAITGSNVGFIDMEVMDVFTKGYKDKQSSTDPTTIFCTRSGAIPCEWNEEETEVQLHSYWPDLQKLINENSTGKVKLEKDYTAGASDKDLVIDEDCNVTIDLNGHTINRNRKSVELPDLTWIFNEAASIEPEEYLNTLENFDFGHVIKVRKDATLTVKDSTATNDTYGKGHITGGRAYLGGGIYVHKDGMLNIQSGTIDGNIAQFHGGAICTRGALTMTGGRITGNAADKHAAGIFGTTSSALSLTDVLIECNTASKSAGALNINSGSDASITNCEIRNNVAFDNGAGIRMTAGDHKLTITNTKVEDNASRDDGAGIYLERGTIEMSGGSLSNNRTYNDGAGAKVTNNTTFIADGVDIKNNKALTEEGGGIKSFGKTTLTGCTISENEAGKQGGGVFNDDGTMTLEDCTIENNESQFDGGGVYSDKKLTIIDCTITGNSAVERGGGVFIGDDSKDTQIKGTIVIKDNTSKEFGDNLFLRNDRRLVLTDALDSESDMHVDLEKGTGVLAKEYKKYNSTVDAARYFTITKGYDTKINSKGELEICSSWSKIKAEIEGATGKKPIKLTRDYAAGKSEGRIKTPEDKAITLNLNGHILNRNRGSESGDGGCVIEVSEGSTLTIVDSPEGSEDSVGIITGGWGGHGGGIRVAEGGTLKLQSGVISGNRAEYGSGIYVYGTLDMSGGTVENNESENSGGGITVSNGGKLNLSAGNVTKNTAGSYGGGIKVDETGVVNVVGNPKVYGSRATKSGNDIYLPAQGVLTITSALTEGAKMGVTLENSKGKFTSDYSLRNPSTDPAQYFVSSDGYTVFLKDDEAYIDRKVYGESDFTNPFIDANNQINTDTNALGGQNWMSGISGERRINEINTPGAHDAGMNNVQNINTSEIFTSLIVGISLIGMAIAVLVPPIGWGVAATVFGVIAAVGTVLYLALPTDYTAFASWAAEFASAPRAKTQKEYLFEQMNEGARQLDIRLNYRHKVQNFWHAWTYEDDGKNLWICHGRDVSGGAYFAQDPDDNDLSFTQVLEWVKEFLKEHPTETIELDLRPENPEEESFVKIYERARKILNGVATQVNPSTGEPYLYREAGSDDFFAPYTELPKLADCRGKIVLMPNSREFLNYIGGFERGDLVDEAEDLGEFKNTSPDMVRDISDQFNRLNGDGSVLLPTTADDPLSKLWYWELNCTGQSVGKLKYIVSADNPYVMAEYVNPHLFGEGKTFGEDKAGQYLGWVKMDSFRAEFAEQVWRTNFSSELEENYCTVTVKSQLNNDVRYPDQTYKILKGTTIQIPGNIYKQLDAGKYLSGWTVGDEEYAPGAEYKVTGDVTFTAKWLGSDKVPVRIVWKDGDDADGLRADTNSIELKLTVGATTSTATLKSDENWSGVVDVIGDEGASLVITPNWSLIGTSADAHGQDAAGTYRYEVENVAGDGYVVTLIHTPQTKIAITGTVNWDDSNNADDVRPESVTLHLLKNGETVGDALTVTAKDDWRFDFPEVLKYEDGEAIDYSVTQDEITDASGNPLYETTVDGFTITNSRDASSATTVEVTGSVEWADDGDAAGIRPGSVTVTLTANAEVVETTKVSDLTYNGWTWEFENLPSENEQGQKIEYSVEADNVDGYANPVVEGVIDNLEQGEKPSEYRVIYILDKDIDMSDAGVLLAPIGMNLPYDGKEKELIKSGDAIGGTMMYAIGESAETAPSLDVFTERLPVAIEAGTYHVWYYVKGDISHVDTEPQCVDATIYNEFSVAAYSTDDRCAGSVADVTIEPLKDEYELLESVTVTAEAKTGYEFLGWYPVTSVSDSCVTAYDQTNQLSADFAYTFQVEEDTEVCAVYKAQGDATIKVEAVNGAGYTVDESTTVQHGSTEKKAIGSTLRLTAQDGDKVLHWLNESNKVIGTGQVLEHYVTGNTSITLVYTSDDEGQSFVQFVSDYEQVLSNKQYSKTDSIQFPDSTPTKYGYTFEKWVFDGTDEEATEASIQARIGTDGNETITIKPKYTKDGTTGSVVVRYEAGEEEIADRFVASAIPLGNAVSLEAPEVEGYLFDHWEDGSGNVLGYKAPYFMKVTGAHEVVARYIAEGSSGEAAKPQPVMTMAPLERIDASGVHKVRGSVTRSVPEGYEIVEHGMLYARDVDDLNATTFVAGTEGVSKAVSNKTGLNGVVSVNLKVATDNVVTSFRGYMLLRDADGNERYYYSEILEGSYNSLG